MYSGLLKFVRFLADRESLERGLDENEAAGAGGLTGRDRGESKAE